MINSIKILFIDLDGTTLDIKIKHKRTLSDKNKKAILQARSNGIEIVISTGGIGQRFHQFAKEIGGNYFIQANGALITDKNNQVLFEKKLKKNKS